MSITRQRYNISLYNPPGNTDPLARFSETRTSPLLDRADRWYMSVARFSIPTSDIPLFICHIQTGQNNANLSAYSVGIAPHGTACSNWQSVTWVPESQGQPTPNPPVNFQDLGSRYYFGNNPSHLCRLINTAFSTLASSLSIANAPSVEWDSALQSFSLLADEATFDSSVGTFDIYMNGALTNLFFGFQTRPQADGSSMFVVSTNPSGVNLNASTTVVMKSAFGSGGALVPWNCVRSILVTTDVPINTEAMSPDRIWGSSTLNNPAASSSQTLAVLTDFEVELNQGWESRPIIQYQPSELRLTDIISSSSLSRFGLQIYWSTKSGTLIPLTIPQGQTATFKIEFRLKGT